MDNEVENEEDIQIRLKLTKKEDPELFNFFNLIKRNLGIKQNTEVTRICIKKAYETWFINIKNKEKENK